MKRARAYFTLGVCLGDSAPETARRLKNFADWELLASVATGDLVAAALYPALQRKDALRLLPPDFAEYLKTLNELNAQRNTKLLATLGHVLQLLNKAGIVPGLLKGAASLAAGLYEDSTERVLGDLDLLVARDSIVEAERCLKDDGFQALNEHPGIQFRHQLEALAHPQRRGVIELHWHIVSPGRGLRALEQLSAGLSPPWLESTLGAERCRLPAPALHLAHRFVHDMVHDPGYLRGWLSMRALYEAYQIERQSPAMPWQEIETAVKSSGVWREWQAYRQALEYHFPALAPRAGRALRSRLWNLRLRAHQQWPRLYTANRRVFQAIRGLLPGEWLRDRGW